MSTTGTKSLVMQTIAHINSRASRLTPPIDMPFDVFQSALSRAGDWIQDTSAQVWRGDPSEKHQGIATLTSELKKTPLQVIYLETFEFDPQDPESTLVHPLKTHVSYPWTIAGARLVHDQSKQVIPLYNITEMLMHSLLSQVDYAYLVECLIQKHRK